MMNARKKIAVLGAGMVGSTIAIDLETAMEVTSFDVNPANLDVLKQRNNRITTRQADLREYSSYEEWLKEFDLVVSAVPGFMGYKTLETLLEIKKNVVDISFFPEDALMLDRLARENKITAIVDCGVAPGMSNLVLGYENNRMKVDSFECMVGGLPKTRTAPFEYKAPFSPADVIEEYTRPARYMENGFIVTRPALSDAELVDLPPVGTLESFNTDGLRSLLFTMKHIPNMKEKTLRYPGHIKLMEAFKKAGFFSEAPVIVKDQKIVPLEVTSHLLFDQWKLQPGENEFTIMKMILRGEDSSGKCSIEYMLYDENDRESGHSSMSRTTGFTCAAAAHLIAGGTFSKHGVFPPELIGPDKACFDFIMKYLGDRGVHYKVTASRS